MFIVSIITVLVLLSAPAIAMAEVLSVDRVDGVATVLVEQIRTLGGAESLDEARVALEEQARAEAASAVGVAVVSTLNLDGGRIEEDSVKMLAAAVMRKIEEQREVSTEDGSVRLRARFVFEVDEESVTRGLERLLDQASGREMEKLRERNEELAKDLAALERAVASGDRAASSRRAEVLERLAERRAEVRRAAIGENLLAEAMTQNEGYAASREEFEEVFIPFVKSALRIVSVEPRFTPNPNGSFDVSVVVDWRLDPEYPAALLEKWFRIEREEAALRAKESENRDLFAKKLHSADMFKLAMSERVAIRVRAGSKSALVAVMAPSIDTYSRRSLLLRTSSDPKGDVAELGDMRTSELKAVSSVETEIVSGKEARWNVFFGRR